MPDLRTPTVLDWFELVRPVETAQLWPPSIRLVEQTAEAETLLGELGRVLDDAADRAPARLAAQLHSEVAILSLQETVAQLGAARTMRITHWLREIALPEGVAAGNAIMRGDTRAARAIRSCITTVTRQATLARLMSEERLAELAVAAQAATPEKTT
ncbi:hypothetical protein [Acidisoma sp. 7E03]